MILEDRMKRTLDAMIARTQLGSFRQLVLKTDGEGQHAQGAMQKASFS